jgi:hemerythrin-like domain-containing protein
MEHLDLDIAQYRIPAQRKNVKMKVSLVSGTKIDPISAWHTEHAYFGSLLGLLQRELDIFHSGERPKYELIQDIVSYLRDYSDNCHHPREDEAFRRLAKCCPDLELPLARLQQEHRVIANAGENLLLQVNAILEDVVMPRASLEAALATYLVYYKNHIAKEEADILTRAAKELTAADWEAVRDAVPHRHDPLFGGKPEERYQELRRQIAVES